MVSEAERYKEEDSKHKKKIDARNEFENYVYSVKNSTSESGVKDKLSDSDRVIIENACKSALEWLEMAGSGTEAEEYEAEKKKLEGIVAPIVSKMYGGGSGDNPAPPYSSSGPGPNIEEVD